jgi:RNA polymerase sigma-70 factor (ECF subfamily)
MADRTPAPGASIDFTTHWSVVVAAGNRDVPAANEALTRLCEAYWYPLYAYIRRRTASVEEAQDLTQEFFARLIEQRLYSSADPTRGRFRSFLLTLCQRFLVNEWHKARAIKRGGGRQIMSLDFETGESRYSLVAVDRATAERVYDREWAVTLLGQVVEQLREEYTAKSRLEHFEALKPLLAGAAEGKGYAEAARTLGISETTAKVAAHRMRRRYRELLRAEIAQTVEAPADVDEEIRDLFAALQAEK